MNAGIFILNNDFIRNSPKGLVNLGELTFLYELKSILYLSAKSCGDLKELHNDLCAVEMEIQFAYGFTPDINKVRWWEFPKCKCPKIDNNDNWGTPNGYISELCPMHEISKGE